MMRWWVGAPNKDPQNHRCYTFLHLEKKVMVNFDLKVKFGRNGTCHVFFVNILLQRFRATWFDSRSLLFQYLAVWEIIFGPQQSPFNCRWSFWHFAHDPLPTDLDKLSPIKIHFWHSFLTFPMEEINLKCRVNTIHISVIRYIYQFCCILWCQDDTSPVQRSTTRSHSQKFLGRKTNVQVGSRRFRFRLRFPTKNEGLG